VAKICKQCRKKFEPVYNSMQKCCSIQCAIDWAQTSDSKHYVDKIKKIELNKDKKKLKEKDKSYWTKKAQIEFNKFIRLRDKGEPCISCQNPNPKKTNAGHYKSVGGHGELRFEESNCHLQCEHCNTFKSGNIALYRPNLIEKIGLERVLWLEGPHDRKKYTIDDLKGIIKHYRTKVKELS
tara:strand:+ start:2118 stop:2660 length:543 start_codon:yes stop_codon:yes gene_type:complete